MADCIFCQIVEGKMPSKKVYEDEYVYAFHEFPGCSDEHRVIPKKHIPTIMDLKEEKPDAGRESDGGNSKNCKRVSFG